MKFNIIKIVLLILSAATLFLSGCIVDPEEYDDIDHSASTDFAHHVRTGGQYRLYVNNINGSVEITGGSEEKLIVRGNKGVRASTSEKAERALEELQIRIDRFEDEIKLQTIPPRRYETDFWVDYHIEVPEEWQINVDQVNGIVEIMDIDNSVEVLVSNGNIVTDNIYGSVSARTSNGNIDADVHLTAEQEIDFKTTNGSIALRIPRLTSASFLAQVGNGVIRLFNLQLQDQQQSSHRLQGRLGDGEADIVLSTVNGNVEVIGK